MIRTSVMLLAAVSAIIVPMPGGSDRELGSTVHPRPKIVDFSGEVLAADNMELTIDEGLRRSIRPVTRALEWDKRRPTKPINVEVQMYARAEKVPSDIAFGLSRPEGYAIVIARTGIEIAARDTLGVIHALSTLDNFRREGGGGLPVGRIVDWPDHRIRALHVVLRGSTVEMIKAVIRKARRAHFNTLILEIGDAVQLVSMPWAGRRDVWSQKDLSALAGFARANGLEVIPEVKLLTKQHKLLRARFPDLMYNRATYDPRREATYDIVFSILDNVIGLLQPRAIHIGHDEVAGVKEKWTKRLATGDEPLPAELFLEDIQRVHAFLSARGVGVWMWGDMLIAPEDVPGGVFSRNLHADSAYAAIRRQIPREIVICDWHYSNRQRTFPSSRIFAEGGHEVLGATWKNFRAVRYFSRYVYSMPAGGAGMIATTWYELRRKNWRTVNRVIRVSGEAFWNAS